jgi:hypothetical protein
MSKKWYLSASPRLRSSLRSYFTSPNGNFKIHLVHSFVWDPGQFHESFKASHATQSQLAAPQHHNPLRRFTKSAAAARCPSYPHIAAYNTSYNAPLLIFPARRPEDQHRLHIRIHYK